MSGANEGIISSLCPIHTTDNAAMNDPLYGYRPAMNTIINRLKQSLSHQCLPQRLQITSAATDDGAVTNTVPCLVLGTFPNMANGQPLASSCSGIPGNMGGWFDPDPDTLAHFKTDQHAQWVQANTPNAVDPSTELTCELNQLAPNVNCSTGTDIGWCYIDNGSVQGCSQSILFNKSALQNGVTTSLQCIEASDNVTGDASVSTGTSSGSTSSGSSSPAPDDAGGASD